MRNLLCVTAAFATALLLSCGSGGDVAGGGTIETTNGFTAVAVYPGGAPAAGALVQVRPTAYVSLPGRMKSTAVIRTLHTAADGAVRADSLDPGEYRVEINDGARYAVMFTCVLLQDGPPVNAGRVTLAGYAAIRGVADTARRYVQIAGLERLAVAGADGAWSISDLPPGAHTVRLVSGADDSAPVVISGVEALAGDTVDVARAAWKRRAWLELNTAGSGADISEGCPAFPLLVRLDSTMAGLADDFFARARPAQLLFVSERGAALPYEIEVWDSAAAGAALWVLLDTVCPQSVQRVRICWDNTAAAAPPSGVFSGAGGFAGVWHLSADSAGRYPESAGAGPGTRVSGGPTIGVAGAAALFDGPGQYINCAAGAWSALERTITVSAWVRLSETAEDRYRRIVSNKVPWYDTAGFELECNPVKNGGFFSIVTQDSNLTRAYLDTGEIAADRWFFVAGVVDHARGAVYVNGGDATNYTMDSLFTRPSPNPLLIGGAGAEWFAGTIDEVRVESAARSASWIKLCYETQRPGQTAVRFVP